MKMKVSEISLTETAHGTSANQYACLPSKLHRCSRHLKHDAHESYGIVNHDAQRPYFLMSMTISANRTSSHSGCASASVTGLVGLAGLLGRLAGPGLLLGSAPDPTSPTAPPLGPPTWQ